MALSGSTPNTARRVLEAIERPELADDPKFATNTARLANADELDSLIADWILRHKFDYVLTRFDELDVPLAPVQGIDKIFKDEHFLARQAILKVPDAELGSIRMQGVVPKLSRTPGRVDWAGGLRGTHQMDVFGKPSAAAAKKAGSP